MKTKKAKVGDWIVFGPYRGQVTHVYTGDLNGMYNVDMWRNNDTKSGSICTSLHGSVPIEETARVAP